MIVPVVFVILSTTVLQADYVPVVRADLPFRTPPAPSTAASYHQLGPSDGIHEYFRGLDRPPRIESLDRDVRSGAGYPELMTTVANDDYAGIDDEIFGKIRNGYKHAKHFGEPVFNTRRPNSDDRRHNRGRDRLRDHGYRRPDGGRDEDDVDESYGHSHGAGPGDGASDPGGESEIASGTPTWRGPGREKRRRPADGSAPTAEYKNPDVTADGHAIVANAHVFKFVKVLLLLVIKLKLLALVKSAVLAKFVALVKTVKLLLLPAYAIAGMLMTNTMTSAMARPDCPKNDNDANTTTMKPKYRNRQGAANRNGSIEIVPPFTAPGRNDTATVSDTAGLVRLVESIRSEPCVERMACLASVSGSTAVPESFWMNGLPSPLVDYIPNEKLRLYISTYKNVSDSRLQHILNSTASTEEWSKWCDGRYSCAEETTDDNRI